MRIIFFSFLFVLLLICCKQKSADWQYHSQSGQVVTEQFFKKEKLSVIAFLAPGCPLSEASLLSLRDINEKSDVQVLFVIPGALYSDTEIKVFVDSFKIDIPLIADTSAILVKKYSARITPEVILINDKMEILYRGAIDNRALDLNLVRQKASVFYLKNAVENYLSGEEINTKITEPVGCFIEL